MVWLRALFCTAGVLFGHNAALKTNYSSVSNALLQSDKAFGSTTFSGLMHCNYNDVRFRLDITREDGGTFEGKMTITPMPHYTPRELYCRPVTNCHATVPINWFLNGQKIRFGPNNNELASQCQWNTDFEMIGDWSSTGKMWGAIHPPAEPHANIGLQPLPVGPNLPFVCQQTENQIREDGHGKLTCSTFNLKACPAPPSLGTQTIKVVYMVKTLTKPGPPPVEIVDEPLGELGQDRARALPNEPTLVYALGNDPTRAAQRVFVSPTARAMETAILAFGDSGLPIDLSPNLMEKRDHLNMTHGHLAIQRGVNAGKLSQARADRLMSSYRNIYDHYHKWKRGLIHWDQLADAERMRSFEIFFQSQRELSAIVVGEESLMTVSGHPIQPLPGTVYASYLYADGGLPEYDPSCAGIPGTS